MKKSFFKNILSILLVIVMSFVFFACDNTNDEKPNNGNLDDDKNQALQIEVISPKADTEVVLVTDDIYHFWDSYHWGNTDADPYYTKQDTYFPKEVEVKWSVEETYDYFLFYYSLNSDMSNRIRQRADSTSIKLNNLYSGTTYYWQVEGVKGDNKLKSSVQSFKTAISPRTVNIEGVSNTRDIGGTFVKNGYRIKQGMVYRGGKLDDITENGIACMLNTLGIKTDFDMRRANEGNAGVTSPLGDKVQYVNIEGRYYLGENGIHTENGKKVMAEEVRLFTKPENYPIYMHCSLGRDRTGTIALILEGLLGASEDMLMMDYELSVFSVAGTLDSASVQQTRSAIRGLYTSFFEYEGTTISKKIENYLLEIGITEEEITSIRNILLEKVQ